MSAEEREVQEAEMKIVDRGLTPTPTGEVENVTSEVLIK